MDGLGEFTFPEIKSYFGYFEKDKRSGFGIMIWHKESKAFIGYWNENKQHGPGKIINNGKIKYGIWENGSYKEKISNKDDFISSLLADEKEINEYLLQSDLRRANTLVNFRNRSLNLNIKNSLFNKEKEGKNKISNSVLQKVSTISNQKFFRRKTIDEDKNFIKKIYLKKLIK